MSRIIINAAAFNVVLHEIIRFPWWIIDTHDRRRSIEIYAINVPHSLQIESSPHQ